MIALFAVAANVGIAPAAAQNLAAAEDVVIVEKRDAEANEPKAPTYTPPKPGYKPRPPPKKPAFVPPLGPIPVRSEQPGPHIVHMG